MKKKFKLSKRTKTLGGLTLLTTGAVMINIIRDQHMLIDVQDCAEGHMVRTIASLGEKLQGFMGKEDFTEFVKSLSMDGYSINIDIQEA